MAKQRSLGDLVDDLHYLRAEMKSLETEKKALGERYSAIEAEVLQRCEAEGLEGVRGSLASATVSRSEVPSVKDWTKATRWIAQNKALHLFERRISSTAYREIMAERKGRAIPGITVFERTGLRVNTLG